jgi:hypothetical protein
MFTENAPAQKKRFRLPTLNVALYQKIQIDLRGNWAVSDA